MTEETRNVIMRNGKMYVGGDVTKEYVDTAIADAVADIDDDISALSGTVADKVDKVNGKGLSTNDYTDADKALVQDSPITVTATGSDLTLSTSSGNLNALTVYGKSEVVDGAIVSAGEGWATVDLGTLTWEYQLLSNDRHAFITSGITALKSSTGGNAAFPGICDKYKNSFYNDTWVDGNISYANASGNNVVIIDNAYSDATTFKTAMSDVLLCYELADPTQGNTIAVKTDDGTGINGTMAVFTTGTPLRGIPDSNVRDVMEWNGSSGEVTKNCANVRLADLTWNMSIAGGFSALLQNSATGIIPLLCSKYNYNNNVSFQWADFSTYNDKNIYRNIHYNYLYLKDTDYTTVEDFVASLGDAELVYELATPTTEPLTQAENNSIAGLKTFTPQTHAQNNAGAEMTVEAYAGTANGKAVAELKSELQITQSDTLTLTVAGWSNNTQTISYEHDIGKRNTIDVEPANIKAWTAAGILATAETASTITFECDTTPTADLSFRVTSMEVR